MPLKGAFLFLAPEGDSAQHKAWVKVPQVHVLTVAAKDYDSAAQVAEELAAKESRLLSCMEVSAMQGWPVC